MVGFAHYKKAKKILLLVLCCLHTAAFALTANKVWFEFHPSFYRVVVQYTIPSLRELREAYVDFYDKRKADAFYWKLVKGADFVLGSKGDPIFLPTPKKTDPW